MDGFTACPGAGLPVGLPARKNRNAAVREMQNTTIGLLAFRTPETTL